jgi:hypothetical protein
MSWHLIARLSIALLATGLILTGCPGRESAHSVQWYIDHPKERTQRLAECHNQEPQSQDCLNASQAFSSAPSSLKNSL